MFSVIIPLYNKENYINSTIQSALAQTLPPVEIIIVDDGSNDDSVDRVRLIDHPKIKIISTAQARSGPAAARNLGVQHASNQWIAFLDADDTWGENYLSSVEDAIRTTDSDNLVSVFSSYLIRKNGQTTTNHLGQRLTEPFEVDFDQFVDLWVRERWCPMWTSAVVVAREPFLASGGFPEAYRRGEDKVAWLRIMRQGLGAYNPAPAAIYNMDVEGQETSGYTNERHALCVEIASFIDTAPAKTRKNLERLYNLQIIRYARDIALREPLSPNLTQGFYAARNPGWFVAVTLLGMIPRQALRPLRRAAASKGVKTRFKPVL